MNPTLLKQTNSRFVRIRTAAFDSLEDEPDEVRLAFARIAVSDPDISIRYHGANVLAQIGTKLDNFRVRQLLKDPDSLVRAEAVSAVPRALGKAAWPVLVTMLGDRDFLVRREAAVYLGDIGPVTVIPVLKERLAKEKNGHARLGLWHGLITLGEKQYLPEILKLYEITSFGLSTAAWNSVIELVELDLLSRSELDQVAEYMERAFAICPNPSQLDPLRCLVALFEQMESNR